MKSFYLGILTITLTSMGCGGGSDDIPLAELPRELAQIACEKQFDCCPQDSAAEFASVEDCTTQVQFFTSLLGSAVQESQTAGRVRYDAGNAGECIALLRGLDCTAVQSEIDLLDCEDFIVPLVDAGGACEQDFECTTGYCDTSGGAELGACAALPALGQECDGDCAQGSYCEFGTGLCEAVKADGTECFFDDECQSDFCDPDAGVCGLEPACM
jgi:hypothetical protein